METVQFWQMAPYIALGIVWILGQVALQFVKWEKR